MLYFGIGKGVNETMEEIRRPVQQRISKAATVSLILLALAASLCLQLLCGWLFAQAVQLIVSVQCAQAGITDLGTIQREVNSFMWDYQIWSVVFYQISSVLVFGLLYCSMTPKKIMLRITSAFTVRSTAGVVLAGIGLEFFVTAGVEVTEYLLPQLIQGFEQQMETAGLNRLTLGSALATIVLAPVGEELLCRGILFRLAQNLSKSFWIANCIQALAFGILHFNLVQGVYAFLLGLVLGMLCRRFDSLYASMLAHLVINASAMILVPVILGSLTVSIATCLFVMLVSALLTLAGAAVIGRKKTAVQKEGAAVL